MVASEHAQWAPGLAWEILVAALVRLLLGPGQAPGFRQRRPAQEVPQMSPPRRQGARMTNDLGVLAQIAYDAGIDPTRLR